MDAALGPPAKMRPRREGLTLMTAQYYELCERYETEPLLFQVGDFYEALCGTAESVARICEITLTKCGDFTGKYGIAGILIDNAVSHIGRLLGAGCRVAIADLVQDPEETTGIVDQAVTRIITPKMLTEDELLDTDRTNDVAALAHNNSSTVVKSARELPDGEELSKNRHGAQRGQPELTILESEGRRGTPYSRICRGNGSDIAGEMSLDVGDEKASDQLEDIHETLSSVDIAKMTPFQALNTLAQLKERFVEDSR